MPDYYFRGTLTRFWQIVFMEYSRYMQVHQQELFSLAASHLDLPLVSWVPARIDTLYFTFINSPRFQPTVSVAAASALDVDVVSLQVLIHIYDRESLEDQPAYQRWLILKQALEKTGLLVNPLARYERRQRKMHEDTISRIEQVRECRSRILEKTGQIPTLQFALSHAQVSYKTCKTHVPELLKNWKNKDYL